MSIMSVLLGVIDEPIGAHSTSMFTNKVGGEPDAENVEELKRVAKCSICGNHLNHITQIYCPLADSPYHRTLNIFACVQRTCWNNSSSWKVFRRQVLDKGLPSNIKAKPAPLNDPDDNWGAEGDWGVGQDDWGDVDENVAMVTSQDDVEDDIGYESNEDNMPIKDVAGVSVDNSGEAVSSSLSASEADAAAAQMQQLLIDDGEDGEMQECVPEDIQSPPNAEKLHNILRTPDVCTSLSETIVFEPYFVSVIDEPKRSFKDFRHEERLLAKYRKIEGFDVEDIPQGRGASGGGDEKYEKTAAKHGDVTFYKFMKKVELQPDQILRYEWNGKPLHIHAKHQEVVPGCEKCGKSRIFELQLMPLLIPQLKSTTVPGASVEFGTALVYVCQDSCWSNDRTFIEECIQVEADPDLQYFK